jgi:hypothetical protein
MCVRGGRKTIGVQGSNNQQGMNPIASANQNTTHPPPCPRPPNRMPCLTLRQLQVRAREEEAGHVPIVVVGPGSPVLCVLRVLEALGAGEEPGVGAGWCVRQFDCCGRCLSS